MRVQRYDYFSNFQKFLSSYFVCISVIELCKEAAMLFQLAVSFRVLTQNDELH